jgi:hypothetical protein
VKTVDRNIERPSRKGKPPPVSEIDFLQAPANPKRQGTSKEIIETTHQLAGCESLDAVGFEVVALEPEVFHGLSKVERKVYRRTIERDKAG